jgi:hypothetical protein
MRNINLFLFFVLLFINKRNDIEYHQKPHAETTKDPRFNGIANAAHCHPRSSPYPKPFKQSRYSGLFVFFNAHPLNQASLFRGFALKKPLNLR